MQFINFLDTHSGSLTFIITAVYVVATIFICKANIKSAEATREQVAEARRQFEEEHRPYISYQIIFERRKWYGMRFTNHGRRTANHVQIKLDQKFIDSISKQKFADWLNNLKNEEFSLGIGQSHDIFFGADEFRNAEGKEPIVGKIIYRDGETEYQESFNIDFERYVTFFSVNSFDDDLHDEMKKQSQELKNIVQAIRNM
nr:hypothetical protein [uncultured Oscillibacter sp.]